MKELIAVVAVIVLGVAIGSLIMSFDENAEDVKDSVVDDIQSIIE